MSRFVVIVHLIDCCAEIETLRLQATGRTDGCRSQASGSEGPPPSEPRALHVATVVPPSPISPKRVAKERAVGLEKTCIVPFVIYISNNSTSKVSL